MSRKNLRTQVINMLFDRQPFFYNLIGGNLVGGAIGLSTNLIWRSEQPGIWTIVISSLDILVAGFFMSRLAWQMEIIYKRIEVKESVEKDFDRLLRFKTQLIEERSNDIVADFLTSILLVIVALTLLGVKAQLG